MRLPSSDSSAYLLLFYKNISLENADEISIGKDKLQQRFAPENWLTSFDKLNIQLWFRVTTVLIWFLNFLLIVVLLHLFVYPRSPRKGSLFLIKLRRICYWWLITKAMIFLKSYRVSGIASWQCSCRISVVFIMECAWFSDSCGFLLRVCTWTSWHAASSSALSWPSLCAISLSWCN